MSVGTHSSYVWPTDYNWMNAHSDANLNVLQQSNINKDLFLPWLMTVWMLGTSIPKSTSPLPPQEKVKPQHTYPYSSHGNEDSRAINDFFYNVYAWNHIEIEFPSELDLESAMSDGHYVPKNILPLGMEFWKERIFITLPQWREGIPVTLTYVNKDEPNHSPALRPYPDWSWFNIRTHDCDKIVSVFRVSVDTCGRLWVIDTGAIKIATNQTQVCPAKILVFDLETDTLLHQYIFPSDQVFDGSLLSYILVDVRHDCNRAIAYVADVFRYGLLVYDLKRDTSWRIGHSYFYPDPLVSNYKIDKVRFQWVDGVFSLALSPVDPVTNDRYLYFHPLSSNREFRVPVSTINTPAGAADSMDVFEVVGDPRGGPQHHASGSAMDNNGVLFYNMPTLKAVGCWNSLTYKHNQHTQGIVAISNASLSFANDMKFDYSDLDEEDDPRRLYVMANRLHNYLYGGLDKVGPNYVLSAIDTKRAIRDTVCAMPGLDDNFKRSVSSKKVIKKK